MPRAPKSAPSVSAPSTVGERRVTRSQDRPRTQANSKPTIAPAAVKKIEKKIKKQPQPKFSYKPPYRVLINRVLVKAKGGQGVEFAKIKEYVQRYPVPPNFTARLMAVLRQGVRDGVYLRIGGKYRLSKEARKEYKKARAAASREIRKRFAAAANKKRSASSNSGGKKQEKSSKKSSSKSPKPKKAKTQEKANKKKSSASSQSSVPKPPHSPVPAPALAVLKRTKTTAAFGSTLSHIWQYLDNDGRWKDYDREASDIVEQCYQEYLANPHMMDVRAVKSGDWQYQVDFINMKQTNIIHNAHRVRDIRRIPNPYLNRT